MAAEPMLQYGNYKPLTTSLILHDEGDKQERKAYIEGFKKQQEIDVLIVNKMLLTGFDAPRLKKLYWFTHPSPLSTSSTLGKE